MSLIFAAALIFAPVITAAGGGDQPCDGIPAANVVHSLHALPDEIVKDLTGMLLSLADSNEPLRAGDVPPKELLDAARFRFSFAVRNQNEWLVAIERGNPNNFLIFGYASIEGQPYQKSPSRFLGGPPCIAIRAALDGVVSPGGFGQ
jgi:hypothetical protein